VEIESEWAARKRVSGEYGLMRTIEADGDTELYCLWLSFSGFILPLKVESQAHAA